MGTFYGILVSVVVLAVVALALIAAQREADEQERRDKFIDELRKRENEETTGQTSG